MDQLKKRPRLEDKNSRKRFACHRASFRQLRQCLGGKLRTHRVVVDLPI